MSPSSPSSPGDFPVRPLRASVIVAAREWLRHQIATDELLRTTLAEHALGDDSPAVLVTAWLLQTERLPVDLGSGDGEG